MCEPTADFALDRDRNKQNRRLPSGLLTIGLRVCPSAHQDEYDPESDHCAAGKIAGNRQEAKPDRGPFGRADQAIGENRRVAQRNDPNPKLYHLALRLA
jgi:hypothetical protein